MLITFSFVTWNTTNRNIAASYIEENSDCIIRVSAPCFSLPRFVAKNRKTVQSIRKVYCCSRCDVRTTREGSKAGPRSIFGPVSWLPQSTTVAPLFASENNSCMKKE